MANPRLVVRLANLRKPDVFIPRTWNSPYSPLNFHYPGVLTSVLLHTWCSGGTRSTRPEIPETTCMVTSGSLGSEADAGKHAK